jgi:hypothetical protein
MRSHALILLWLAACSPATSPASAPLAGHSDGDPADPQVLQQPEPVGQTARDCTVAGVNAAHARGHQPIDCGALEPGSSADARRQARQCVTDALAGGRPFVFRETLRGIDSTIQSGYFAVPEHGQLAVFGVDYDSDPCGGGCPQRGGSRISRCSRLTPSNPANGDCQHTVTKCFVCQGAVAAERCQQTNAAP